MSFAWETNWSEQCLFKREFCTKSNLKKEENCTKSTVFFLFWFWSEIHQWYRRPIKGSPSQLSPIGASLGKSWAEQPHRNLHASSVCHRKHLHVGSSQSGTEGYGELREIYIYVDAVALIPCTADVDVLGAATSVYSLKQQKQECYAATTNWQVDFTSTEPKYSGFMKVGGILPLLESATFSLRLSCNEP